MDLQNNYGPRIDFCSVHYENMMVNGICRPPIFLVPISIVNVTMTNHSSSQSTDPNDEENIEDSRSNYSSYSNIRVGEKQSWKRSCMLCILLQVLVPQYDVIAVNKLSLKLSNR